MVNSDKIIKKAEEERNRIYDYVEDAAWYLIDHDEDLIPKQEAIDQLNEELDIDFSGRVLAEVVGDIVDPVIQVSSDGDRYVGSTGYREEDGWYGYVHYDDIDGKMRRGVCAQCVAENRSDRDIAHADRSDDTDWDEVDSVIRQHYVDEHSVAPEDVSVEIGASLLSGTTISGNTAWHAGNDGTGSGLDADTVDGSHASDLGVSTALPTVEYDDSDNKNITLTASNTLYLKSYVTSTTSSTYTTTHTISIDGTQVYQDSGSDLADLSWTGLIPDGSSYTIEITTGGGRNPNESYLAHQPL